MRSSLSRSQSGMTLIELMVVVAVIAILAAIAYPSYQGQIRKSNRTEAKTALMQAAQQMERCYTRVHTFVGCVTLPFNSTPRGAYQITDGGTAPTASTFQLRATPLGAQAEDTQCGSFTITDTNLRTVSGTAGAAQCW